jgi:teichuronic acid biosynthesis glycosyltransferase TuaG
MKETGRSLERTPKVSVIITTYNSQKYIEKCIQSVIKQTYRNFEIIIIDDCSDDNTRRIIFEKYNSLDYLKFIGLDQNSGGPSLPRNIGIEASSGEFICFLDADDFWYSSKLEAQVSSGYYFSFCSYDRIKNGVAQINKPFWYEVSWKRILIHNCIGLSTVMISRKLIGDHRFCDIQNEDLFFFYDILKGGKVNARCVLPEVGLSSYTVIDSSRSSKKIKINFHRFLTIINKTGKPLFALFCLVSHPVLSLVRNHT